MEPETTEYRKTNNLRLVCAILLPFAACGVQWLLWAQIKPFVWFLFFPTVFFSAWLGGMIGGLVSTAISSAMVWYFFIPPQLSWQLQNPNNLFAVVLFIGMGSLFSLTFNMLKKANLKLEESNNKIRSLYEKTKELDTLKTQFFANVSHELRTPLALILGPVTNWLKSDDLTEQKRGELEIVERNARLLHRQVNDLLDVAKLEAGRMQLNHSITDLAKQTRLIASHFTILADEKNISYSVEADTALTTQIDSEKFQRIVLNLLSNAFKFTPDHGSIHVKLQKSDDHAVLTVRDTGPGIPEGKQEIIFESFRQLDGASNRHYGGTGLGLSIVKEFALLHGGTVSVTHAPGGGALFTVSIPIQASTGSDVTEELAAEVSTDISKPFIDELRTITADRTPIVPAASIGSATVLVVEDNPDMNTFICSILQPHFQVLSATNGNDGLQTAQDHLPDLIVSDIMMPGMSGDVMVEEIRRRPELQNIPVILLTAKADDDLQLKMLSTGVNDYIRKPFLPDELLTKVSNILRERRDSRSKLYLSEDRFISLVKASPTGIFQTDTHGSCLYVNERWCDIAGLSLDETVGDGWAAALHPDDRQKVFDAWNYAVKNNITFNLEYRFLRPNGETRWVYGQAVATSGITGDITGYVGTVTDITEYKLAADAIVEKEKRFRSIFDNSPVAIGIGDLENGQLIEVNEAWLDLFGFDRHEVLGHTTTELNLYVNVNDRLEIIKTLKDQGDILNKPLQLRRKNGDVLEILYSAEIITLDSKPYLQVMMTDVTDKKRKDEEIMYIKMLFEQSFEQSPVSKVLVTMPGAVVHAINPACLDFLGIADEAHELGGSLFDFVPTYLDFDSHGNPCKLEDLPLARALGGEKSINEEHRIVRKNGTEKWALVSGVPVCDAAGNVIAGYLLMVDITEHKLAEREVTRLTALLNESQNIAQVGGWEIDLITNQLYWTDETYRIHDTSPEEYTPILETAIAFYAPESLPIITQAVNKAIEDGEGFNLELKLITAKGRPILVHTTCKIIMENNKAVKIMGAFKDITQQKLLQEQLQQAQKMESVGRLAGGVAHDFNNMLSVIMGHAELGLMNTNPNDPVVANLKEISSTAERSADLTRQLLAFARKQTISPRVLNPNDVVTGTLKMLQRLIGEDICLLWQPAPHPWLVNIDPSQIDQILANLCVNARDAISSSGRISVEVSNKSIDSGYCSTHAEAEPGEYICLSVNDNGCGMDKETLTHVFEPFYTTKGLGKGTGLGLATVYGIVKQNKGFINIYSEPGHGTTFSIFLPRHEGHGIHNHAENNQQLTPRGQETILLVEDEAAILNITGVMLEKQGYTVLRASSPGESIEIARKHAHEISLLITDVIMPEMNGRDLAKHLLSMYPKIKPLFMSGYTADIIAHHGVLDDGVHFIQKPFSLPAMANKVREILDGSQEATS